MVAAEENKTELSPGKLRRLFYGLSWAVIWPVIVALPAFIVMLIILSQVLTANLENKEFVSAINTDGIFYLELYLFGFVAILVAILFGIRRLLKARRRLFFRSGASVLGVYIWVGIFATGLTMALITHNAESIKPPVSRDENVAAVIYQIGGKDNFLEEVSMKYVDGYENAATNGQYTPVINADGTLSYALITVKTGIDPAYERTVVAHEYLHHIWQSQLDQNTLHNLTSQLMTLYGKDSWMQDRTNWYSDTNALVPTELFSFYCTEASDKYLSQYVLDTCNKYIDRSVLKFTRV